MIIVCNATPLILLAKLSDFQLLKTLYQKIYLSKEVYDEVVTMGKSRVGAEELGKARNHWIEVKTVSGKTKIKELQDVHGLGQGEASAIILAQELQANFVLTDDGPARKFAKKFFHGMPTKVSGTLGILKFAVEKGTISKTQMKAKIEFLRQEGFYLKDTLYQQILKEL